jgi:hypothetical protein
MHTLLSMLTTSIRDLLMHKRTKLLARYRAELERADEMDKAEPEAVERAAEHWDVEVLSKLSDVDARARRGRHRGAAPAGCGQLRDLRRLPATDRRGPSRGASRGVALRGLRATGPGPVTTVSKHGTARRASRAPLAPIAATRDITGPRSL